MHAVFTFLKWAIDSMARGIYPSTRHDLLPLEDGERSALANQRLLHRIAIVYIKADWSELSHSFGFPSWNDGLRPCPLCNCHAGNMNNFDDAATVADVQWELNTEQ